MKDFWQKLGKALMMPISLIAAAGIFLGIGSVLQNPDIVGEAFTNLTIIQHIIGIVRTLADAIFGNLPLLFAVSLSIGLAKKEKTTAAFSGVIGFILFHIVIQYLLEANGITPDTHSVEALIEVGVNELEATQISSRYESVLGIFTMRMNVFGGILVGSLVSWLHNRFYDIELPIAINFFGGKRFVPIITTVVVPFLSLIMYFVWPYVGGLIESIGGLIAQSGLFGTFIFGFLERLLIPTGLHHILNQLVRFTDIGGIATVGGEQVYGALNIFNGLLAENSNNYELISQSTRFLAQGKIPFMVFGLPAAAFAMFKTAFKEKKNEVKGLMSASGLASFTTGITEPIEFSFIFVSPILYVFHALMAGMSFMLMDLFNVAIGNVQGGLIDLLVFGVFQGLETNWYWAVIVGLFYAVIYYYVFKMVIENRQVLTPGRVVDEEDLEVTAETDIKSNELGSEIVKALGGSENIESIDNCFTRLRLVLQDTEKVDVEALKRTGAAGTNKVDNKQYQVIYGLEVENIVPKVKEAANYDEK